MELNEEDIIEITPQNDKKRNIDKLHNIKLCERLLETFEDWMCPENWNYGIRIEEFCKKSDLFFLTKEW